MDQGTTGMISGTNGVWDRKNGPVPETAAQLEDDIERIRNHLSDVTGELDRRRHRALDFRGQLRRRARPIAFGALALAAAGLGIRWWRGRSRRSARARLLASMRSLPSRVVLADWFNGLRARVAKTIHPAPPTHPVRNSLLKVSTTGVVAAGSVLAKRLAGQLVEGRWPEKPVGFVRRSDQDCPSGYYAR